MNMSLNQAATLLVLLLWTTAQGEDVEVSCVLLESCVLPCSFDRGEDPVIHWMKEPYDKTPVHSYYYSRNQFQFQHQNYKGRTSLFEEELSTGNASLLLSEVRGQDEGRYKCYANPKGGDNKESYVNVKVDAPVLEVSLQQEAEQLLCRSEGLFHKPSVSWRNRTEPLQKNQSQTHASESGGGVWSVLSSVSLPHKPPHEYSCNVSTPHSWRSATYRRSSVRVHLDSTVVIPCSEPTAPVKSLVWRLNLRETILTRSGPEQVYSESWRRFVDGVSENNSLVLKGLTKDHLGLFSCELCTEHETFFIHTQVTEETDGEGTRSHLWITPVVSVLICIFICVLLLLFFFYWRRRHKLELFIQRAISRHETELEKMKKMKTDEDRRQTFIDRRLLLCSDVKSRVCSV